MSAKALSVFNVFILFWEKQKGEHISPFSNALCKQGNTGWLKRRDKVLCGELLRILRCSTSSEQAHTFWQTLILWQWQNKQGR